MVSVLGPSVGYVDLLDKATTEHLEKEQAEGREYSKTPFRPSAAGKCTRELFYEGMQFHKKAKYETEVKEPEVHRLLNLGHHIETHIIRQFEALLKPIELRYKQQVLAFGKLEAPNDKSLSQLLEGSLDTCFFSPDYRCVVDFKSKKDGFSSYMKSRWDESSYKLEAMESAARLSENAFWVEDLDAFLKELNDPFFEANFLQLNLYANSDFLVERGVDHAAIIQYNKNTSQLREVRFKPSRALYDKVIAKFQVALEAVDAGDPEKAPKDYALGSMKCAYCPFSKQCHDVPALQAWYKTLPPKQWPTNLSGLGELGSKLETLFDAYAALNKYEAAKKLEEAAILKLMAESKLNKVRTASGDVYEAKFLKSPTPHYELRRGKA